LNICLTGGAGYIGSHTATVLDNAGHFVTIFDNFSNSYKSAIGALSELTRQSINCVEGDILDTQLIENTLKDFKIDAVIHFAGLKAVGDSEKNPLKYYQNNVCGTLSLLEAMKNINLKKLVFSSSATVYGIPKYLPYDESHPLIPINPYGRTKFQIEQILQDIASSDKDWRIIALRYFNPVGAHESGLIGENPKGIPNNLIPYLVRVARGDLPALKIFGNDYPTKDGTGIRDYIHVMDLAEGHVASLEYLDKFKGFDTFNLGTGIGISVLEMVLAFEKMLGMKIKYEYAARRQGDLASYYANPARANEILNWNSKRTLYEIVKSSWESNKKIFEHK
jgi:UDP-glucose 4-epimerase